MLNRPPPMSRGAAEATTPPAKPRAGAGASPPRERIPGDILSPKLTPPKRTPTPSPNGRCALPANVPKPTMYQLVFPTALESLFAPLDDAVVRVVQRRTGGLLHSFVMSLTFFSAIECALPVPAILHALGYDRAAALCGSVVCTLCFLSQIPKKFVFRPRPWMAGRALSIRQDKTSSFPSRAVVCAVVFSWLIGHSLALEGFLPGPVQPVRLWAGIVVAAAMTSFARINVGAHYASDTICGFILGLIVLRIGNGVEAKWQDLGCAVADAYPAGPAQLIASAGTLTRAPMFRLAAAVGVSYALTLVSIQGFWVKCSYVYGLLLASATFRAVFACPNRTPESVVGAVGQVLEHGGVKAHAKASFYFLILLLFGMATRGNKGQFRIIAFTLIYFTTLGGVLWWRLGA